MQILFRHLSFLMLACAVVLPVEALTLYRSSDVVMKTIKADGGSVNQHPIDSVNAKSLARLLASLQLVSTGSAEPFYLMSERDAREMGVELAKALGRVNADQDIHLSIFRKLGKLGSTRRHATGIRLFVQEGQLHLLFGQTDVFLNSFREPDIKLPRPGSREASVQEGGSVVKQSWLQPVNGRNDWLSYRLTGKGELRQSLRLQESGSPVQSKIDATSTAAQEVEQASSAAPQDAAREVQSQGLQRWRDLEEGLETLQRLRSKDLIDEQEYQDSRARLMRKAGL